MVSILLTRARWPFVIITARSANKIASSTSCVTIMAVTCVPTLPLTLLVIPSVLMNPAFQMVRRVIITSAIMQKHALCQLADAFHLTFPLLFCLTNRLTRRASNKFNNIFAFGLAGVRTKFVHAERDVFKCGQPNKLGDWNTMSPSNLRRVINAFPWKYRAGQKAK